MSKKIIGVILVIVGLIVLVGSAMVLNAVLTINDAVGALATQDLGAYASVIQEGMSQVQGIITLGIAWTVLTIISGLLNIVVGIQMIRDKL